MLLNDIWLLEITILLLLVFYSTGTNLLILLSVAGLYLMLVGIWALLNEGDIYAGFLWVIDLGVGLIFLIFILHFTSFFFQKSVFNLSARYYIMLGLLPIILAPFFYLFGDTVDSYTGSKLNKAWAFKVLWLDYYTIYFSHEISELNTLKANYFLFNSFAFYVVNFNLFFGLMTVILLYFLIQRLFAYLNFSETHHFRVLTKGHSNFFIRNQNFSKQQNTFASLYSWKKQKRSLPKKN